MKRIISIITAMVFALSIVPFAATAADTDAQVLPDAYVDVYYKQLIKEDETGTLDGKPYVEQSMPGGLSVEKGTGGIYLVGIPTVKGSYTFTIMVSEDENPNMQSYKFRLDVKDQPIVLPAAYYNARYNQCIFPADEDLELSTKLTGNSKIPEGMSLSVNEEGLWLTGISKKQGFFFFTVLYRLTSDAESLPDRTCRFELFVSDTPKQLPEAYEGVQYKETLTVYCSTLGCEDICISEGELPKGLEFKYEVEKNESIYDVELCYTFYVEGAPTEKGFYDFTLSYKSSWGVEQYRFRIYVTDVYSTLSYACAGVEYEETIELDAETISVKDGTVLPEGIEIDISFSEGKYNFVLKGIPKETGDFYIGIDAVKNGEATEYFYKITVREEVTRLGTGFRGEVYRDMLFDYPNADVKAEDTLPKGLSIERTTIQVGMQEAYAFRLEGTPEKPGSYEFTVKYSVGDKTILTQKYSMQVKAETEDVAFAGSFAYGVEDELYMFSLEKQVKSYKIYGNIPEGITFTSYDMDGFGEYKCTLCGTPKEHMNKKYIFEVEMTYDNGMSDIKLCVLYVAESRKDIGPLPMYNAPDVPLTAMVGGDIEGLQSMELLLLVDNVTLKKTESGEYKLQIKYPIDESKLYLLPILVKYTDKDTNKTVETIVQYRVVITEAIIGDSNLDGKVDTADAVQILKYSAGMIQPSGSLYIDITSDVNHDNAINTADAVLILKYAAGMIPEI